MLALTQTLAGARIPRKIARFGAVCVSDLDGGRCRALPFMTTYSPPPVRRSKPLVPAWVVSIVLHLGTIIALCMAIQPVQHGTTDAPRGSMSLVIHRGEGDGARGESAPQLIQQAVAVMEAPAPPLLLVSAPVEPTTPKTTPPAAAPRPTKPTTAPHQTTTKTPPKQAQPGANASGRPTGLHGGSGTDGYGETSVFGVQGKGSKFLYVFDRSASMEGRPLAAAKRQLLESVQTLDSIHQFHIIFFNTGTQSLNISGGARRIAFASERNKKLAANFVGGVTADGGTDRMHALKEALAFAPDVIFFLTDADDAMSASEMTELARINEKMQASICVIEFGKNPAPVANNFLARMAAENGGQYGYVDITKLK